MSTEENTVEAWPTLYEQISSKEHVCPECGGNEMHINRVVGRASTDSLNIDDNIPAWCRGLRRSSGVGHMSWVRYADDYGPRVALSFPYNNEAKDALKGELGFPAVKWDGEKKAWSIRDKPDELSRALEILEQFGYYFDGLETQSHATFSEVIVTSRPPDKLSMKWPYKPNYARH